MSEDQKRALRHSKRMSHFIIGAVAPRGAGDRERESTKENIMANAKTTLYVGEYIGVPSAPCLKALMFYVSALATGFSLPFIFFTFPPSPTPHPSKIMTLQVVSTRL